MAKVNIDIPQNLIDQHSKEHINNLERLLKNAEKREDKLKSKNESLQRKLNQVDIITKAFEQFIDQTYDTEAIQKIIDYY